MQSDLFNDTHASVTVMPVTTTIVDAPLFRLIVEPSAANGLRSLSQIMVDKLTTVRAARVGKAIGRLEADSMHRVNRALALWCCLA